MSIKCFFVSTFTSDIFKGNPACVVPLDNWLSDKILLQIAKDNALPETAFFIKNEDVIHLRWFTPDIEIDLCGHATLATAHVINKILKYFLNKLNFKTKSGSLKVNYINGLYYLNLPSRIGVPTILPEEIKLALNIQPKAIYKSRDFMLVYENQDDIKNITINRFFFDKINLGYGGVIVTSKGDDVDFVSRFFTPQASILEDPVTGSAHCTLIPYWSSKLLKNKLVAQQLSNRGGEIICKNLGDRVIVAGKGKIISNSSVDL